MLDSGRGYVALDTLHLENLHRVAKAHRTNAPESLNAAWEKLQGSHPELLGDMSLFVQEATVDGKSYYRVQTGPFPNRATAVDLCAQLKVEQQDCLVVRR